MAGDFPFFPESASTLSGQVDAVYFFLVGLTMVCSVLIAIVVLYFAIRYRRRSEDEIGADIHGSTALEVIWTVIPLVVVLVTFVWGAKIFFAQARPPADAMEVYVVGKQWMWKLQHPSGKREINELHVPVGVPVRLTMTSEDVIHDFFVPAFRIKADVLPGRYTTLWFEATKTGTFHLFCAEYCGAEHSQMIGRVVVMEKDDYQSWLQGGSSVPLAQAGEQLFASLSCATCHRGGSDARGPSLNGVYGRTIALAGGGTVKADEGYLRESILDPTAKVVEGYQPIMPTYKGQVSEESILQLISYIRSLSADAGTGTAENGASTTPTEGASR